MWAGCTHPAYSTFAKADRIPVGRFEICLDRTTGEFVRSRYTPKKTEGDTNDA